MSTVAQPNVATSTKVVQVRGVSKIFKRDAFQVTALDDVSIDIAKGEFLALMGPSGSGKTTLMNLLSGLDSPTEGELIIAGKPVAGLSEDELVEVRRGLLGFAGAGTGYFPLRRRPDCPLAKRAHRICVSDLQSDSGTHGI